MKSLILILIYFVTFVGLYLIFSTFALIWKPYMEIIQDGGWTMCYTIFFGWWLALFPAREYYVHNSDYFDKYVF